MLIAPRRTCCTGSLQLDFCPWLGGCLGPAHQISARLGDFTAQWRLVRWMRSIPRIISSRDMRNNQMVSDKGHDIPVVFGWVACRTAGTNRDRDRETDQNSVSFCFFHLQHHDFYSSNHLIYIFHHL